MRLLFFAVFISAFYFFPTTLKVQIGEYRFKGNIERTLGTDIFLTTKPGTVERENGVPTEELVFKGQSCKKARLDIDV
jgi:hypothetical protein